MLDHHTDCIDKCWIGRFRKQYDGQCRQRRYQHAFDGVMRRKTAIEKNQQLFLSLSFSLPDATIELNFFFLTIRSRIRQLL